MKFIGLTMCILLITISSALASPRVGQRPGGICTRDLNPWGHASRCTCIEGSIYDERAGLCLNGDEMEAVTVQGAVSATVMAIGGETTGVELTTPQGRIYELILKLPDQEKLKKLDGIWFEVVGELIAVESVERTGRQAIIVDQLAVLE